MSDLSLKSKDNRSKRRAQTEPHKTTKIWLCAPCGALQWAQRTSKCRTQYQNLMSQKLLERVRKICLAFPETSERLSHGEPTFFVGKKVFAMFSNNHHQDGHIAVVIPAPLGIQTELIAREPETFYRPPYVGGKGWIGIELSKVKTSELVFHLETAWELAATPKIRKLKS